MNDSKKLNWLLLRGLGRESRHWESFPDALEETFGEGSVHFLDIPGCGQERRQAVPSNMNDLTDHLRKNWKRLKVITPGSWGLITLSLGGMVGMNWCKRYPKDFSHLVLMNSSAKNLNFPWQRLRPKAFLQLFKIAKEENEILREQLVLEMTSQKHRFDEDLAKKWSHLAKKFPISRFGVLKQAYLASRFKAPKYLKTNVLVMSGLKDEMVDTKCSEKLATHLRAPLKVHTEAGHDLALDAPAWSAREIKQWVSTIS
jgi:pimeloyl-ACP methyl ester carboxylesterase